MTHWLIISSPNSLKVTRAFDYKIAGMKQRWRKAAASVRPGDTLFFYVTGLKAIAAELRVVGTFFEDNEPIWLEDQPHDYFALRFPTEPVKVREAGDYLSVKDFLADYQYARKWSPQHWTLAFQGNVHRLNEQDYQLIHNLL